MDKLYKDENGKWHPSIVENNEIRYTLEDGHTYSKNILTGGVGHLECQCLDDRVLVD